MAETNPYAPGTARYKLWERRNAERKKKAEAEEKEKPRTQSEGDSTREQLRNRRRSIDDAVDSAERQRVNRMRNNQYSDRMNS